jgi:hypothetical protein
MAANGFWGAAGGRIRGLSSFYFTEQPALFNHPTQTNLIQL